MPRRKKQLEIKVGQKFRWYDRDLWHIIAIINDNGEDLIILKSWAKYKSRWVYKVEFRDTMEYWFQKYNSQNKTDAIKSR